MKRKILALKIEFIAKTNNDTLAFHNSQNLIENGFVLKYFFGGLFQVVEGIILYIKSVWLKESYLLTIIICDGVAGDNKN